MAKTDWTKLQDFANEHKQKFFAIADPKTDEIFMSFQGLSAFVKFPMEDMTKGVVFNALRKSKFDQAIDAFMTGFIDASGIDVSNPEGNELLKTVGGGMKALGIEPKSSKLEVISNKKNGKSKKGK